MAFNKNYLPAQTQPWAREVQKRIENTETAFRSAEVNNTTRDDQLASSLRQVQAASAAATTAANSALAAFNGLTGLGEPGSEFPVDGANLVVGSVTANEIDAGYVYAGVIDADQINAGILTGFTVKTAPSGQRVELSGSDIRFYNTSTQTGNIVGSNYSGANSLSINNPSGVILLDASSGTYIDGGLVVSGGTSILTGISNSGTITSTSDITTPAGTVSGATVSAGNFSGIRNTSIASNTQSTFAGNLFINSSGNMFRDPTISSQEAKENVVPYEFDTDAFIAVNPVTFNYKEGVFSNPGESEIKQLGFVLEDFEDAGLGEHLVIPKNEVDQYKGLRYDKLYMMLHKVVQEQDKTIKALEARVTELEDKVK